MEQKDLAKEYAHKAFLKRNRINPMSIHDLCFSMTDIKAAFNAWRESVVENIPELEWKGYANFKYADTYIGRYNIDDFGIWLLRFNGVEIPLPTGSSLEAAKQAANEDYKERIKQALEL